MQSSGVCLVCLKEIPASPDLQRKSLIGRESSKQGESKSTDNQIKFQNGDKLYSQFIIFAERYLRLSPEKLQHLLPNGSDDEANNFCDDCESIILPICQLYKELCSLQLKIAWRLNPLIKLIENSIKSKPSKLTQSLQRNLEAQLHLNPQVGNNEKAGHFTDVIRKELVQKCERKIKLTTAMVTLDILKNDDASISEAGSVSDKDKLNFANSRINCDSKPNLKTKSKPSSLKRDSSVTNELPPKRERKSVKISSQERQQPLTTNLTKMKFRNRLALKKKYEDVKKGRSVSFEWKNKPHEKPTYSCTECRRKGFSRFNLQSHFKNYHKQKECPECEEKFTFYNRFVYHLKTEHGHKFILFCPTCREKFHCKETLFDHIKCH